MLMIRTFTKILVTSLVLSAELTAQQCDGAGFGGGLIEARSTRRAARSRSAPAPPTMP